MIYLKTLLELSESELRFWALFPDIYELHFDRLHSLKDVNEEYHRLKGKYSNEKKKALDYFYAYKKNHINEELIKASYLLKEYKFDKISGVFSDEIINFIKKSKLIYDKDNSKQVQKLVKQYTYPLLLTLKFIVARGDDIGLAEFSGESDERLNGRSILRCNLFINPKDEPKVYNEILGRIKGLLRHEIEHKGQQGINRISDRPEMSNQEEKLYSKALDSGDFASYFLNKMEIPAYIKQMYIKAKFYRIPIDAAIDDFLDSAIDAKYINNNERQKIKSIWVDYIRKNLPGAKFII